MTTLAELMTRRTAWDQAAQERAREQLRSPARGPTSDEIRDLVSLCSSPELEPYFAYVAASRAHEFAKRLSLGQAWRIWRSGGPFYRAVADRLRERVHALGPQEHRSRLWLPEWVWELRREDLKAPGKAIAAWLIDMGIGIVELDPRHVGSSLRQGLGADVAFAMLKALPAAKWSASGSSAPPWLARHGPAVAQAVESGTIPDSTSPHGDTPSKLGDWRVAFTEMLRAWWMANMEDRRCHYWASRLGQITDCRRQRCSDGVVNLIELMGRSLVIVADDETADAPLIDLDEVRLKDLALAESAAVHAYIAPKRWLLFSRTSLDLGGKSFPIRGYVKRGDLGTNP